ncbi:MAG: hypothetical protein F6K48_20040 [Okeania sp. SIO3H1]|nr:hypothetical protein [Okeania sp. SIO3H1]
MTRPKRLFVKNYEPTFRTTKCSIGSGRPSQPTPNPSQEGRGRQETAILKKVIAAVIE